VLPELLTTDTIDLEGNELRIIRIGQADTAESTVLHIPSLGAVVTGDLAYNEVHMMTAETGETERSRWIANLGTVAALEPTFVVAGHKKVANDNDPKIIAVSQQYLRDFSAAVTQETTAAAIVSRMVERYADWENLRTLWYSARTAVARKGALLLYVAARRSGIAVASVSTDESQPRSSACPLRGVAEQHCSERVRTSTTSLAPLDLRRRQTPGLHRRSWGSPTRNGRIPHASTCRFG
jgi:hypothetical protein